MATSKSTNQNKDQRIMDTQSSSNSFDTGLTTPAQVDSIYQPPYTVVKLKALLSDPQSFITEDYFRQIELDVLATQFVMDLDRAIAAAKIEEDNQIQASIRLSEKDRTQFNDKIANYYSAKEVLESSLLSIPELSETSESIFSFDPAKFTKAMWVIHQHAYIEDVKKRLKGFSEIMPDGSTYTISQDTQDKILSILEDNPTSDEAMVRLETLAGRDHPAFEAQRLIRARVIEEEKKAVGSFDESSPEMQIFIEQKVAREAKIDNRYINNQLIIAQGYLQSDFDKVFEKPKFDEMKKVDPNFAKIRFIRNLVEIIMNPTERLKIIQQFSDSSIRARIEDQNSSILKHHKISHVYQAAAALLAQGLFVESTSECGGLHELLHCIDSSHKHLSFTKKQA